MCVLKILLIFGGGGRFFYEGKASAEDLKSGMNTGKDVFYLFIFILNIYVFLLFISVFTFAFGS